MPDLTISEVTPATGNRLGTEPVTIRGTGFVDGAVVSFGGLDLPTTYVSETQLDVVTTETSAGVVDVTVTNPEGASKTLASAFEFIAVMTISDVTPTKGNRVGTETVTISGTVFVDGAVVSFGGVDLPTTYVSETQLDVVTAEAPAGVVDVTVTNPGGASETLASAFEFFGVTMTFIYQNGFRLDDGNSIVYVDAFTELYTYVAADADVILITHDMSDHLDTPKVVQAALTSGATVVATAPVITLLTGQGIDAQLVTLQGTYGDKVSGTYAGVTVDAYITEHIGQGQGYDHLSFRVELGRMVMFFPGDMTTTNWTGPLANYPELMDMDVAMGSAGFVTLSVLASQNPTVLIEVHNTGTCTVYPDNYPGSSFNLSSQQVLDIPR